MNKHSKNVLLIIWLIVVVGLISSATTAYLLTKGGSSGSVHLVNDQEYAIIERYGLLESIRMTVADRYYVEPDDDVMMKGAIDGMLASLDDPYTFYYTSEEMQASRDQNNGVYHGIGMVVVNGGEGKVVVSTVYEDSPAEAAGIEVGDVLLSARGEAVSCEDEEHWISSLALLVGEDGDTIDISVLRDNETIDCIVTIGEVNISYVSYEILENNIGYLQLAHFDGDAVNAIENALEAFRAADIKGLIFDLRNNPGGNLDIVLGVSDMLLPEGLLTAIVDRNGERTEYYVDGEYWDIPMVLLVNGYSASASELFTAGFKDMKRGTIVGTTTYGKGIVQTVLTFPVNGDGIQLTTASYYTPSGASIHKQGITPDVIIENDGEEDKQLAEAIKILGELKDEDE